MNTVDRNHLYPAAPPLTRYKEAMFPVVKKKVHESVILGEEVVEKLEGLTAVKLCVRLNTLEVSPAFLLLNICDDKCC